MTLAKPLLHSLIAFAVLVVGIFTVSCFGSSRYAQGKIQGRLDARAANIAAVTRAIDSTARALQPTLDNLIRVNDSLRASNSRIRDDATRAENRAVRASARVAALSDSIRHETPPQVLAALDSLDASNIELRHIVDNLTAANNGLAAQADSAISAASEWRRLQQLSRVAIDSMGKQIADLKKLKKPARCGFKCGVVSTLGVLGVLAAVLHVTTN